MADTDLLHFEALKKEVERVFRAENPSCDLPISEWKGQDIVNFQEELMDKVGGRLSEKWFYTHIKGTSDKLPREDMLNLLSEYAGFKNWRDFRHAQTAAVPETEALAQTPPKRKWQLGLWTAVAISISTAIVVAVGSTDRGVTHTFCFIDADQKGVIQGGRIDVILLNDNESPTTYAVDSSGCLELTTERESVRFVVKSPYYKTDTVTRFLTREAQNEEIRLHTDDYALMMHIISNSKVDDWKRRRAILNEVFADNARIVQVYEDKLTGMEIYNKNEFVNKLTMPSRSLKNIEVIDVEYAGNQIRSMRFMQRPNSDQP